MAESTAERTEPATPRRLDEARRRGQVPHSRDLAAVVGLGVAVALLVGAAGDAIGRDLADRARLLWSGTIAAPRSAGDFHALLLGEGIATARALAPFVLALAAAAFAASFVQVGPLLSSQALAVRLERLDPVKGLQRLANVDRLVDLAKALVKLVLAFALARAVMVPALDDLLVLLHVDPVASLGAAERLVRRLAAPLLAALAALAALDVVWVRFRHAQRLRMTRQEVREEVIQREGNPHLRARMRQVARELSRTRLIAEVSRADVVVRNPTHFAVALVYERGRMAAPRVVARGRGRTALRILEVARAHEVPIVEDPPLARLLYRSVRVGGEIPVHLYEAIAEVLAWVYRIDRRRAAGWGVAS